MLARYYQDMHHVELDPETEIVVTTSGVQALNAGIRCALDPGDEGIVLTPAWPNQSANVRMANGVVREIPHIVLGGRFTVDFDALEAAVTQRTRLLVYTSPSNPLGWTATEDEQRRLLDFARRHGLWLLADEVYERLYWRPEQTGTPAPSILRMATREDAVMVVQSFSKSYCMTGWRVGWLVARKDLAARATILNEFIISHAPSFAQRAAESALEWGDGEVKKMLAGYRANRDFCLAALRKMKGVQAPEPEGAFYLFPRIDAARDSFAFCKQLLLDTKVGLAPGIAFGAGGEGSVRICYAAERQVVETAMQRLAGFLS
jgi:aspartate/methionine/tyrosine aminotransferase